MSELYSEEPMLDMYIFETTHNLEQLEKCILETERSNSYSQESINEIFRIMHTIKGSSAMMLFNNISSLAHAMEDLFYFIREQSPENFDNDTLSDLVLEGVDYIKEELLKIKCGDKNNGECTEIIQKINVYLSSLKNSNPELNSKDKPVSTNQQRFYISPNKKDTQQLAYKATIKFEDGCEMENVRSYSIIHNLKELCQEVYYMPNDIIDNDNSVLLIRENGFKIYVKTEKTIEELQDFFDQTFFVSNIEVVQLENDLEFSQFKFDHQITEPSVVKVPQIQFEHQETDKEQVHTMTNQSMISVNVLKLDKLMDLVGEMVIAEAMVTQNPDLKDLQLTNFHKATRQLHKITSEIQDMVMSIRMVPLASTFQKLHRIVRDMSKKLNKEIKLELIGEETEVDKNIIEHISDPLMHLVRNSIDHGLESLQDREALGKPQVGKITLEAKSAGSDVLIVVRDDGKGLNKTKILNRARENNLLFKSESEMTDKEIFNLIFLPGFSTKEEVSEYSGRGVGMDVVTKNIEQVGGTVSVESIEGEGTSITLKIPLTLAIIDGMNISVGNSRYTIPINTIRESFRPVSKDIIRDTQDNEMIMVRGKCYPIFRLHKHFKVNTNITKISEGILIMVEQEEKSLCIYADELIGQQQVVVKSLPNYIRNFTEIKGVAGCTLLGDGSISLILDIGGLEYK